VCCEKKIPFSQTEVAGFKYKNTRKRGTGRKGASVFQTSHSLTAILPGQDNVEKAD